MLDQHHPTLLCPTCWVRLNMHHVGYCCIMLDVVGSSLILFKLEKYFPEASEAARDRRSRAACEAEGKLFRLFIQIIKNSNYLFSGLFYSMDMREKCFLIKKTTNFSGRKQFVHCNIYKNNFDRIKLGNCS
jgi:hypothetical protein